MASSRNNREDHREENLIDLGDSSNQSYNPGRPTRLSEDELARRASISQDNFLNDNRSAPGPSMYTAPGALPTTHRTLSQQSFNDGYNPYDDAGLSREDSRQSQYYNAGRDETPDLMGETRQRKSYMGGMLDRLTGNNRNYSDMDVPLTETRPRDTIAGIDDGDTSSAGGGGPARPRTAPAKESGGFRFGFGRRTVDPSTLGPRIIYLNNPTANAPKGYVDNHVSTTKYNVATFLPKFLYEQFSKYANLFFLFTAGLQQIPNISPTNRYTTIGPLIVVLLVSAGKEAIEDWKRRVSDQELNKSKTQVLQSSGEFAKKEWIGVKVGDIVMVESGESFPADLALISTSEPDGLCYIETANLDGETNLKVKQSLPETHHIRNPRELSTLSGEIKSEQPNSRLYTYEATLTLQTGGSSWEKPLGPDQLLLRGAVLRNTGWIVGAVVFTGHETKLMRNATATTPIKRTAVEATLNIQIVMLVGILLALSLISSTGDVIKQGVAKTELAYLFLGDNNRAKQFFSDILTYWVLYSNLVPISLFVTVEIVKYYHAFLINSDLDIYYEPTDTAAVCRTSSLVEELGQIEYIFSDKTGTLTCNMMEFKQCSVGGIQYGEDVPEDRRAGMSGNGEEGVHDFKKLNENLKTHPSRDTLHHFLALLAVCHTVIPEKVMAGPKDDLRPTGDIKYQAASPDEGALVEGAADLGYKFTNRTPKMIECEVNGRTCRYDILGVCEFNSTRKRMSIIVRDPDGQVLVYCKGADTVITERLSKRPGDNPFLDTTNLHLEEYASEGLRTLCLAMRKIPEAEYQSWARIYDEASKSVSGNRADELDKAAEIIERDFVLLGATAIEDRLQDGVPETIHTLQTAGIKIWVLTGDRQETAINIGMSCKLISEEMQIIIVNQETYAATEHDLKQKLASAKKHIETGEEDSMALVIDGASLTFALEEGLDKIFLDLAVMCKAVICCRVSPLQKALVVKLVKRHLKAILLAVGDGANDVSMIQAAHVGVGISGVEGLQAARSADVAIGQFRFLRKLLLVHGAWSYQRISKVILYSFYKNITLYMTQFWYSFQNAFSGQVIYESWTLSFYNVFFTVLPPLVMGIFDQFISARLLDRYPQLYQLGQKGVFFKSSSFWAWLINGFYHSLLLYIFSEFIYQYDLPQSDGMMAGHWQWGTSLYTACLATVLGKAALVTNLWTKYTVMAIPGSMLIWMIFLPAYATVAPMLGFSTEYFGILKRLIESPVFWAMAVVLPALCLVRDFAWKYVKRMYYPQSYHHIQEIQKYNIQDYRPRMEQFQKAIRKVRQVQRMRRQRGFAFSQGDESQSRILEAYDTTLQRGKFGEMLSVADNTQRRR